MKISRLLALTACLAVLPLAGCDSLEPTVAAPLNPSTGDDNSDSDSEETTIVTGIPEGAIQRTVTLNADTEYQTIVGFSASDCWQVNWIGKYWTGKRAELAQYLFSRDTKGGRPQGIGLSMWRVNLGGGSYEQGDASGITTVTRRAESYRKNGTEDEYDWDKCEGQRYFMEQAKNAGIESIVFFSNSPLVQYTKNGQARSDAGSDANLKDDCYDAFAGYLADVAKHFREEGYPITHISPINEPQYSWNGTDQEGSGYRASQQVKLIKALDAQLTAKGVETDILPGEVVSWAELYSGSKMADVFYNQSTYASTYIGNLDHVKNNVLGVHSYWNDNSWDNLQTSRQKGYDLAVKNNVQLWETEWSMLDSGYSSDEYPGFDNATEMQNALYMSRVIHKDLTVGNVSSWSYWTSMDVAPKAHKNRFVLIELTPKDGLAGDVTAGDGTYSVTPNLWVLGNYSYFIRPGYIRIATTLDSEDFTFFGSSYKSPDGSKIVSVYTNYSNKTYYISDTFSNRSNVKSIRTYTTSESKNLQPSNISLNGGAPIIEPWSVVTVVYEF
jgi:O-glycosyl hydrolase